MTSEWLSAKEAAAILGGVSEQLIYKLFHKGELKGIKVGGAIRLRADGVAAYLAEHSNEKKQEEERQSLPKPRRNKKIDNDFISYYLREMARIDAKYAKK